MRVYSNWNPKSSTLWIKKVGALFSSFVTLLFPLCSSSPVNTSQFSSCLNGHFGGNPTSPQSLWSQGTPPGTFLQLSPPKYQFRAARNGTCLPFSFLFQDVRIRTIQLKHEGWSAFFGLQPARMWFCGLQPTDNPLRPGSHQWTHSTALSLFRWPEQSILSKNE